MNRLVTRGLGPKHLCVTQGYGGIRVGRLREIIRLLSCLAVQMRLISAAKRTEGCPDGH